MGLGELLWDSARWYLAVSLLSWICYPLLFRSLAGLPDRGLTLVRPLGLLLAIFPGWWLSGLGILPYQTWLIVAVPLVVAVPAWVWEIRRGDLRRFVAVNRQMLIGAELVFLLFFLGYVLFRSFNPAIAFTEKPMELGLLSSTLRAQAMPPADPWFANESINYYYLGYVLAAAPARVASIPASVAFNLELATLFAMAAAASSGAAANLTRLLRPGDRVASLAASVLGPLFLVGVGNLVTPIRMINDPRETLSASWWQGVGWQASRVIVDGASSFQRVTETINEFPAFSFVLGDLHPHVLALPLFVSVLSVSIAVAHQRHHSRRTHFSTAALCGVVVGSLYAINSWDMPPALLLLMVSLLLARPGIRIARRDWLAVSLAGAVMVLAALPFLLRYRSPLGVGAADLPGPLERTPILGTLARTIGLVAWPKSSTAELLQVHGLFLLILIPTLAAAIATRPASQRPDPRLLVALPAVLVVLGLAARFPAIFLFGLPLALASWLALRPDTTLGMRLFAGLSAIASALVILTELVFLMDAFGNRMNTVFKVYFQVWAIFAVACAVAAPWFLREARARFGPMSMLAAAVLALVVAGAAIYPPLSAMRWTEGFRDFQGLDGLAYLSTTAPDEAAAVAWLNENLREGDHVLEAPGCSYGVSRGIPHNRVSMSTGAPTIVGWQFHEYQWRAGQRDISQAIERRQQDARVIYETPGSAEARDLIERYNIRYVYVGQFERTGYETTCPVGPPYSDSGLREFERLGWPVMFQSGRVSIYGVPY